MQWFTLAFATVAFCAVSMARSLPNGMVFYQSAPVYYKRSAPLTHRMMYVQYLPQHANRRSASAGGVSAFASGDTIATGTYLKDCNHHTEGDYATPGRGVEYQPQDQEPIVQLSDGGATSVAEAYPEQTPLNTEQLESEEPDFQLDPLKVDLQQDQPPLSYVPEVAEVPEVSEFPETATEDIIVQRKEKKPKELVPQEENIDPEPTIADEPSDVYTPSTNEIETPIVAVPVPSYIQPKKKIRVELEAPESTEYENEHPYYVAHYPKKTKGISSTKPPSSFPAESLFSIDFGGASGGAIAIANSYSTGEGGSASSTATAYGSPSDARLKAALKAKKRLVQEQNI